jgi:rhodanese-related sulfurtransferase
MAEFNQQREVAPGLYEVGPEETLKNLSTIKVIDVRRPDEFTGELGHIKGAQLATLEAEFPSVIEKLPKNETYVFVCRSGARSLKATAYAHSLGFEKVFNMAGGMMAWNSLGLEKETT